MGGGQSVPCHDGNAEDDVSVLTISEDVVKLLTMSKESDEALSALDDRWMKSLKGMDELHTCKNGLTQGEFFRMVQVVESRFAQLTNTNAACHYPMERVFKCYTDHPNESLMCAREVMEFHHCVDENTVEKIKDATLVLCKKDGTDGEAVEKKKRGCESHNSKEDVKEESDDLDEPPN